MKEYYKKKFKILKILSLIISLFIGIGAFVGGICMLIKPDGSILQMQTMLPYFEKLPFSEVLFKDYLFSGISLIIVNGITNIIASIYMIINKKIGYILNCIFGFTLMLWICIQFYLFAPNIYAIDIIFFLIGLTQFVMGYSTYATFMQTNFKEDIELTSDYSNKTSIVVYFSRMGYTKKKAYEKANELNCKIVEIKTKEKIDGTPGFWWCGRFGMHRWKMSIEDINIDFDKYDEVYLFSPIWVFQVSAPMKGFLEMYGNKLHKVHLYLNHFQKKKYNKEFIRIENTYHLNVIEEKSICTQLGKEKYQKNIKSI